jgi:CHASE2 domain-containing sensor protein
MSFKKLAIDSFYVTVMLLGLMWGLSKIPVQNFDVLNPLDQAFSDFELTDIVFSHLREQPAPNNDITVVNIGELDRLGIAMLVDSINLHQPKVMALDIRFFKNKDPYADSVLASCFSRVKTLVLANKLETPNADGIRFDSIHYPIPLFRQYSAATGFVNVISEGDESYKTLRNMNVKEVYNKKYKSEYVRTYTKTWEVDTIVFGEKTRLKLTQDFVINRNYYKDTTVISFPVTIARHYNSSKFEKLMARGSNFEITNYRGNIDTRADVTQNAKIFITAVDWNMILDTVRGYDPSVFNGKIVLLGYLGDHIGSNKWEDKYHTPLNSIYIGKSAPDMYGVMGHANGIAMVLAEDYVNNLPDWVTLLINLLFIYINIIIYSWMFLRLEMWWDGASLVATLVQVSLIIVASLAVFNKYSYKLDFTLLIVALFLCGNFIEFYFGLIKPGLLRLKSLYPGLRAKNNVKQENID